MTLYVDIVRNDLSRRLQTRVAKLRLVDDVLEVDARMPQYRDLVLGHVARDAVSGEALLASKQPRKFLHALHRSLNGSLLFASQPYEDESSSPFSAEDVRYLV